MMIIYNHVKYLLIFSSRFIVHNVIGNKINYFVFIFQIYLLFLQILEMFLDVVNMNKLIFNFGFVLICYRKLRN